MNKDTFSFSTVSNFDNHISKSISNYDYLHDLIKNISSFFIKKDSICYDIGSSTGKLIDELSDLYKESNFIGIEKECNIIKSDKVINADILFFDLQIDASLIYSIFTVQFIDVSKRVGVLQKIYNSLHIGGAFILAEKVYVNDGLIQEVFTFANYDYKKQYFTADEILQKEKDIRSIMKPLTETDNVAMLKKVGFVKIEKFYQSLNFCAWIAIK